MFSILKEPLLKTRSCELNTRPCTPKRPEPTPTAHRDGTAYDLTAVVVVSVVVGFLLLLAAIATSRI